MGKFLLELGERYRNGYGDIAKIVERHKSGDRRRSSGLRQWIFVDQVDRMYTEQGVSLSGNPVRNLCDWLRMVSVGDVYDYHWPDRQSVGRYVVTQIHDRGYEIVWSNGATMFIQFGCPLNYDAVKVQ